MTDDAAQARLRRGRRVPALRRPAARRRARRRPADHRDARPARRRVEFRRRPPGHHARRRWTSCGWCSSARCSARSSGWSTRTARSRSACPARTRTCSPPSARPRIVDGETVDVGLVGDVVACRARRRRRTCSPTAGSRSCPASRRGDDGDVYNVNADTAAAALAVALGAEKLVVLTDVEGLYADWPRPSDDVIAELTADELDGDAAVAAERHGAEDGGLPARRTRRRAAGARARRPGAARAAARGVHRRGRRHAWWCRDELRGHDATTAREPARRSASTGGRRR